MTTSPRELSVLTIDDVATDTDRTGAAIATWLACQRYWLSVGSGNSIPDIVLCDVNFQCDTTSPLNRSCRQKPTGFLYALPFLAVARATGGLLVLEFHSGTIQQFTPESDSPEVKEEMRLLAAELAGMVHALTADPSAPPLANEAAAWEWIRGSSGLLGRQAQIEAGRPQAEARAFCRYRREFVKACETNGVRNALIVDPAHYVKLVNWASICADAADVTDDLWEQEPGVVFSRADGTRDCIRLRSFFREAEDFANEGGEPYRPAHFRVLDHVSSGADSQRKLEGSGWMERGHAHVGAFIHRLGFWPSIYEAASAALEKFNDDGTGRGYSLSTVVPGATPPNANMIRLLAMVFQIVRLHRFSQRQWEENYREANWDPKQLHFVAASDGTGKSLQEHLKALYRLLFETMSTDDSSSLPSIQALLRNDYQWPEPPNGREPVDRYIVFHLDLLARIGVLRADADGYALTQIRHSEKLIDGTIPACPDEFIPKCVKMLRSGLGESFGVKNRTDDTNALRRISGDALFAQDSSRGQAFNDDLFDKGIAPKWLSELARTYARERLGWSSAEQWPEFMQRE